jgi:hypothetical protein
LSFLYIETLYFKESIFIKLDSTMDGREGKERKGRKGRRGRREGKRYLRDS